MWLFMRHLLTPCISGKESSVAVYQLPDREPDLRLADKGDDDAGRQGLWIQVRSLRQVPDPAPEGKQIIKCISYLEGQNISNYNIPFAAHFCF